MFQVQTRSIEKWEALIEEFNSTFDSGNDWIFRGQADAEWSLSTSLERTAEMYSIPRRDLQYREGGLIRRFKRQYYHYFQDTPDEGDYIEWLAVMQHYGAPTRLLDWTYSFFPAVFFAVEKRTSKAAVWALNTTILERKLEEKNSSLYKYFRDSRNIRTLAEFKNTFARNPPIAFVQKVNPYRLNQRLILQQGVFLCPGNIEKPFEENLAAVIGQNPTEDTLIKLTISEDLNFRKDLLKRLHRMNMNRATLFPGLDGFAGSLNQLLVFPKEMLPPEDEYLRLRC
jgi:hypothetical protein